MAKRTYHVVFKLLAFFFFGLGGALLSLFAFPVIFLFVHPLPFRKKILRRLSSGAFRFFTRFMSFVGLIRVGTLHTELLARRNPSIICANHPSLLDVVLLIGLIPNADCIVKADHWKNPFLRIVLSSIYIPNSLNVSDTVEACRTSLEKGNHIILFPEGTRTPRGESSPRFHRSAAQIALRTGHDIIAVNIRCSEFSGLGKEDKIWDAPPGGVIEYFLEVKDILSVTEYEDMPIPVAARQLTKDLKSAIFLKYNKKQGLFMNDLEMQLKNLVIESLDLEDMTPDDIPSDAALFGDDLGLDSIDALELGIAIKKKFNITLSAEDEENREHFYSINTLKNFVSENIA